MEKTLDKKQGKLTGWLAGGIISGFVYIAALVFFYNFFSEAAAGVYDATAMAANTFGAISDSFGLVVFLMLVFFIGLLAKKSASRFFVKFFIWAVLIASLYYVMPRFVDFYNIVAFNSTITTLQTLHILCLMVPQIIFTASILAYIIQMDSKERKVAYTLSWIAFLAAIVMFVVEAIYVGNQISVADRTMNIFYYSMDAFGIFSLIFFSMVIHKASKKEKGEFFGL